MKIKIPRDELNKFCQKWKIKEFSLFGSVLRDDFRPDSDIDVLVSFEENAGHTLFDLVRMEEELKKIFGRDVDLVDKKSVERSENYIRRKRILSSYEVLYVA